MKLHVVRACGDRKLREEGGGELNWHVHGDRLAQGLSPVPSASPSMAPSVGSSARAEPTRPLIGVSSATQADGGGDDDAERAERAAERRAGGDAVDGVEPACTGEPFSPIILFSRRGGGGCMEVYDGQSSALSTRESIGPSPLPIVTWPYYRLVASLGALDSTGTPCSLAGQPRGGQGGRRLLVN